MGLYEDLKQAHLDERCPRCKAEPGAKCQTPKGAKMTKPHADRIHNGGILFEERLKAGYYARRDSE